MVSAATADSSRFLARFAAFVAIVVGAFVLLGWGLDMDPLTNIVPGWPRMARLSAVAFILSGVALWLGSLGKPRPTFVCAGLVIVIGFTVLLSLATVALIAPYLRETGDPPADAH